MDSNQAQVGDIIEIIDNNFADWVDKGDQYTVLSVGDPDAHNGIGYLKLNTERNRDYYWACNPHSYRIIQRQVGESIFDKEALLKQQRRLLKENALQRAAKDYPAGTKFKSMGTGDIYTMGDKPEYSWSENTEGIYAWATNSLDQHFRIYICKRGDWAEKITDEFDWETAAKRYKSKVQTEALLQEAAERFPPGTRFTNVYGSTSVISDDPDYTNDGSYVYAKCVTGKRVTICVAGEWRNVISKAPSRAKLKAGDRIYIKANCEGAIRKYAGNVVTIAHDPYRYSDGSYHVSIEEAPKKGFLLNTYEWEPATDTSKQIYDVRYGPESSTYEEFLDKYFYKNKNQINGTESNKSVKLQGTHLEIREGYPIRGIGLKGSGSKIKLGSNNSYN